MAEGRVFNFSAGPCCLPLEVLEQAKADLVNHQGSGMSIMEMSHRSKEFVAVAEDAEKDLRTLLNVPDNFKVLFLQGGATAQFAAVPLNLFGERSKGDYLITGQWGEKAHKECSKYGTAVAPMNTKEGKFTSIPDDYTLSPDACYVHYCHNETVNGVEWSEEALQKLYAKVPDGVHLVADVSSNFLTRPIDFTKHSVVYAGAQKNAGPAGVTIVFVREELLNKEMAICPAQMSWGIFAKADSMYNTPPCWTMYMCGLVFKFYLANNGIETYNKLSDDKSKKIYDAIESGFYTCPINPDCRSRVNIPFVINKPGNDADANAALEKDWLAEAKKLGLTTLAGHRSVGGIRASLYNGMPMEGIDKLVDFMGKFSASHCANGA